MHMQMTLLAKTTFDNIAASQSTIMSLVIENYLIFPFWLLIIHDGPAIDYFQCSIPVEILISQVLTKTCHAGPYLTSSFHSPWHAALSSTIVFSQFRGYSNSSLICSAVADSSIPRVHRVWAIRNTCFHWWMIHLEHAVIDLNNSSFTVSINSYLVYFWLIQAADLLMSEHQSRMMCHKFLHYII